MKNDMISYETEDGLRLQVKTDGETIWLSQDQMCQLFGRDRSVISKHIRNVFSEGELPEEVSCAKFAHNTLHGAMKGKTKTTNITIYNLNAVKSAFTPNEYLLQQLPRLSAADFF